MVNLFQALPPIERTQGHFLVPLVPLVSHIPRNGTEQDAGIRADFSAMSPDALCLSFVRQDAAIKVDEEGSEAAAVSSAGVFVTSPGPNPHAVFHANHPFLYLITESSTGAVLFAGRYCGE